MQNKKTTQNPETGNEKLRLFNPEQDHLKMWLVLNFDYLRLKVTGQLEWRKVYKSLTWLLVKSNFDNLFSPPCLLACSPSWRLPHRCKHAYEGTNMQHTYLHCSVQLTCKLAHTNLQSSIGDSLLALLSCTIRVLYNVIMPLQFKGGKDLIFTTKGKLPLN